MLIVSHWCHLHSFHLASKILFLLSLYNFQLLKNNPSLFKPQTSGKGDGTVIFRWISSNGGNISLFSQII